MAEFPKNFLNNKLYFTNWNKIAMLGNATSCDFCFSKWENGAENPLTSLAKLKIPCGFYV